MDNLPIAPFIILFILCIVYAYNYFIASKKATKALALKLQLELDEKAFMEKCTPFIKEEYETLSEILAVVRMSNREDYARKLIEKNSICPKCNGHNIIDKVIQQKGSIDGSSYSYRGTGSGSLSGSWDTKPVNRCKDCENEWVKVDPYLYTPSFDEKLHDIHMFYYVLNEKKDADDILAPKNQNPYESQWAKKVTEFWGNVSIETINYLKPKYYRWGRDHEIWDFETLKKLGITTLKDKFQNEESKKESN